MFKIIVSRASLLHTPATLIYLFYMPISNYR
jgi:hypothetical protein